jgi:RHS repeat-associated protein
MGSGAVQWQTQYTYYPWTTANGQGRPWLPHQGRLHILQSGPLTNTTLLQNLTYTYDAVGNVKTIVDGVNFGQRQCFQYDPLDRLTRATTWQDSTQGCTSQLGEPISNYSEGYEYYKGGSLKRKGAADNANDGLYTYDAGHPHAVATYRGNSYGYDAVGNMITRTVSGVTYTLTYNAENRLTQVVSGTLTASYTYDGDGNRVRSVITAGSQVTETHYVGQHYEKTVGSGDTKYYYIAGQLVAFERSSGYGVDWGRRFVFRDHLGSTNVIINGSSGLLLWRDRYLPFGDVRDTYRRDAGFSLQTQYRFTGQRLEQRLGVAEGGLDRGLYFYGSRWYDSSLGRFIQADTIVPQPGNPQSLNRYSYVLNNALRYTDPTGMFSEDELLNKYKVFIGPRQLRSTRDTPETAYWYYLLRAAEIGDTVRFGGERGDVTGQIIVEDERLWVAGDNGIRYSVSWHGLGGIGSGISPQSARLTKADGATLNTEAQLRRHVNGPHSLLEADYVEASLGGYWGVGGHVSVKHDRYGTWHLSLNAGVGIGKLGWSIEGGNLIQDSPPDPGQIAHALDGWGMSFQGGFHLGGALPVVNTGPQPVQLGYSTPGLALVVSYTWPLGGR